MKAKSPPIEHDKYEFDMLSTGSNNSIKMDKGSPVFKSKSEFTRPPIPKMSVQEELKRQQIPFETVSSFYQ